MKLFPFTLTAFLGTATLFLMPAQQALAQAKGSKGGAASRSASPAGGAKAGAPKVSNPIAGNKSNGIQGINQGSGAIVANRGANGNFTAGVGYGIGGINPYYSAAYSPYYAVGLTPSVLSGWNPYVLQGFPNNIVGGIDYSVMSPPGYAVSPFADNTSNSGNLNQRATAQSRFGQPVQPGVEIGPRPVATATGSVVVVVPTEQTELWFNGVKTQTPGQRREFATPELAPGQKFVYEVKARWIVNGQAVEQTRSVTVQAGSQAVLNFTGSATEQVPLPVGIKI